MAHRLQAGAQRRWAAAAGVPSRPAPPKAPLGCVRPGRPGRAVVTHPHLTPRKQFPQYWGQLCALNVPHPLIHLMIYTISALVVQCVQHEVDCLCVVQYVQQNLTAWCPPSLLRPISSTAEEALDPLMPAPSSDT